MNLTELALREAALKALAEAVAEQLKDIKIRMQEEMDATGASRVEAKLPDGTKVATIYSSDPKPAAQVVDAEAFLAWVRKHSPCNISSRLVTEVRPAYQTALLAEMTAAGVSQWADRETGEVHDVDGVEVRATRSRSHSVRTVDGGREAIAAAWRGGQLAHLDLLQLTAGGDQ